MYMSNVTFKNRPLNMVKEGNVFLPGTRPRRREKSPGCLLLQEEGPSDLEGEARDQTVL